VIIWGPAVVSYQAIHAAEIDETMPGTIPSQIIAEWEDQDSVASKGYGTVTTQIVTALPDEFKTLYNSKKSGVSGDKNLYYLACHYRRVAKMKPYSDDISTIIFAKHHNLGGFLVGYHDNVDAMRSDDEWAAKGAICILNMKNYYSTHEYLIKNDKAVLRDPCISFDGKKVLYAMSGSNKGTGYRIYEAEIANPTNIKQLTTNPDGSVVADFEPCYLQNGDIAFSSTRCFGMVDCAWNPTTNMFIMNGEGKYIRRVGFDQVHTFYPVLRDDGTLLYTRWEYNDRVLTNCMGLFYMNPDGSHQTEYYGNQSSWPYTKIHARPIPNSDKVICVGGGHHGPYSGELMIIDRVKGTNGKQSVQMIAPIRECKATVSKTDMAMGDVAFLFQTPLPLDEENFLVSWRKAETEKLYKLYFMDVNGKRELLAWDDQSLSQPVFVKTRKAPPMPAVTTNYADSMGEFTMQDVYVGAGLKGVKRGKAKKLRVIQINYRVQGGSDGFNTMDGNQASGFVSAPVARFGASWESKTVLGETPIFPDGSAAFKVPARTPVYFQVLDSNNYCIATMRSWSTLMPGEKFACVGCHESKLEAPPVGTVPMATDALALEKTLGVENEYFDYRKFIQPILDKNCISCHKSGHSSGLDLTGDLVAPGSITEKGFSASKRSWTRSYLSLTEGTGGFGGSGANVNFCTIFSPPEQQMPNSFGAVKSSLMSKLKAGHNNVKLTDKELNTMACWIDLCCPHAGYYNYYMSTTDSANYAKLENKRIAWEKIEAENIKALAKVAVAPGNYKKQSIANNALKQNCIEFIPKERSLVLNKAGDGKLLIIDLTGKVINSVELSSKLTGSTLTISLPVSLAGGVYIARFEGVTGNQERMISVTK
jgi:Tol biopolymer transport system component